MNIVEIHLPEFNKAVEYFRTDIAGLKTGRANPAILDKVMVDAYGAKTLLSQLSSISVPEARSIVISPWDKNIAKDIEKAISEAGLGLNPVNEGERIRITIPQMTEESRKEIVKLLKEKIEKARVAVRTTREEIKEKILLAEKNKEFGEDEKFRLTEELDKKTGEYNDKIKELGEHKENEILTV